MDQEERLRQLLRHAKQHSAFYRQRLNGLDLQRCPLADIPPLSKPEMMANFMRFLDQPKQSFQTASDINGQAQFNSIGCVLCHTASCDSEARYSKSLAGCQQILA